MNTNNTITSTAIALTAGLAAALAGTAANADVFQRYAGSPEREQTYSIEQTMDGGYITTGFRDFGSVTAPAEDVIITKHFPDGSIEWQRIWEGPGRDIGYSVQQTFDGGYIVAAESTSSPDPSAQTLLIRLDPIGNPVWQNFYFGTFQTDPIHAEHPGVAIDQGFNGQIYLVSDLFARPMILAVDPSGALIWNAVYSDPVGIPSVAAQFAFTDIKHDPTNGTLVVSGTTQRNEPTPPFGATLLTQDAFLFRLSDSGSPIWIWNYDFPFDLDPSSEPGDNVRETGDGLDISPSGRIILNGRTDFGGPAAGTGTHLVSVDPNGFPTWSREYRFFDPSGIPASIKPGYAAVRFDANSDIIQAGTNRNPAALRAVQWRTQFGGAPQWMFEYGGPHDTRGESVIVDQDCGYAMAGALSVVPPAAPFLRGEGYLVKNNDDGNTGCAEIAWQFGPDYNAVPKQNGIIPDYIATTITAPSLLVDPVTDEAILCYDSGCGPCPCDLNGDGMLDLADIGAFITCFTGSLPCGDIAAPFGVWDLNDVNLFITCFTGGCP